MPASKKFLFVLIVSIGIRRMKMLMIRTPTVHVIITNGAVMVQTLSAWILMKGRTAMKIERFDVSAVFEYGSYDLKQANKMPTVEMIENLAEAGEGLGLGELEKVEIIFKKQK